nr:MAG TPA: hypothetical protein [Caudoviricetes sp.]
MSKKSPINELQVSVLDLQLIYRTCLSLFSHDACLLAKYQ